MKLKNPNKSNVKSFGNTNRNGIRMEQPVSTSKNMYAVSQATTRARGLINTQYFSSNSCFSSAASFSTTFSVVGPPTLRIPPIAAEFSVCSAPSFFWLCSESLQWLIYTWEPSNSCDHNLQFPQILETITCKCYHVRKIKDKKKKLVLSCM